MIGFLILGLFWARKRLPRRTAASLS
jgi:hypothetical protein